MAANDYVVEKKGPWGGGGKDFPVTWDFKLAENGSFKEITIYYGEKVDSITFVLDNGNGETSIVKFGDNPNSPHTSKITLDAPQEHIRAIEGEYHDPNQNTGIRSLKIVTNTNTYGPYGGGSIHSSKRSVFGHGTTDNASVVGFYGGGDNCSIGAIGIHYKQPRGSSSNKTSMKWTF